MARPVRTTKLEQIITTRGIRKFRIAQCLDMSESTLSAWMATGLPRNVQKAAMLAELLDIPLEDLLENVEDLVDKRKLAAKKRALLSDKTRGSR